MLVRLIQKWSSESLSVKVCADWVICYCGDLGGGVGKTGKMRMWRSSHPGSLLTKPTCIHDDTVLSLASLSGLRIQCCCELWCRSQMQLRSCIAVSCDAGRRCSSDPALLWLWCRPADTAPIRPVALKLRYASGVALKRPKKRERERLF